ncbi:Tyrosine kinase catalytic domain protein [Ceratobasidium sp. AG-Ba]|nr:Tyrosine kinase catalytic domain protein [Ceratobasidium sp. AG-Ba]QRW10978.1 Tyrosine kinase catalytic domain protein [Ceratobasidium sp. AG-Ba]
MITLDLIMKGGFSFIELSSSCGIIPALPAACIVLEHLWNQVEQVKANKERCKVIRARCVYIFITIRDNAGGLESTVLNPIIEDFITWVLVSSSLVAVKLTGGGRLRTIKGIHSSMNKWSDWSVVKSFVKNDEIATEIDRNMNQLDQCCTNFQIATQLQIYNLNQQMDAAREADYQEMKEMMISMLDNQDRLKEDLGLLMVNVEKFVEIMKTFQLELRSHPAESASHAVISRGLLNMQHMSGELPPIAFLEGHECKLVGTAAIAGSTIYDVYEGLWLGEEKVAVKVLRSSKASDNNVKRFNRQVKIWHRMKSKYILRFYGVASFAGGNSLYLVSPWCENGDAPKYLKRNPNADRLKLILEIAYGLRYIHSQNPPIVHGSLQGSNVLIGDGGGALLADFGLAKALEDLTAVPFTQSTGANGCYRWMAPELHEDGGQMTLKSDTYSWAMTALELYSDRVPYAKIKMPGSVVMEVARGRVPERPRPGMNGSNLVGTKPGDKNERDGIPIPDRLWNLLVKCWAQDGADRPTIQEVIEELEDMRRTESVPMEL